MTDRDALKAALVKAALVKALHTHLCYTSLVADEPAFRDVLWPLFLREYAALAQPELGLAREEMWDNLRRENAILRDMLAERAAHAAEPGLDVERLVDAIVNVVGDKTDFTVEVARAIAAEYARLGAAKLEASHD